ncbi:MAG: IclR family transcriptional regulator, partial [Deltaproteobacteria bacterium]|nr:IclR family transcriptional regulator [Deltaproteobacteria bacterium]
MKVDTIEQTIGRVETSVSSPYRSLEKALDVLNLFNTFSVLTVTEISRKLGYPKSTISGLLKTFGKYELVEKDSDSSFRLGIKAFELGFRYLNGMEILTVARLWAERLLKEEGEAVHIAIRRGWNIYIILDLQPPNSYMTILQTGMNVPAHSTALGKVLMSDISDEQLNVFLRRPLERLTERTITQPGAFREELKKIRETGYAMDMEESLKGLICISAPIFQRDGRIIASIGISSIELPGKDERIQALVRKTKAVASNISMDIGYQPVRARARAFDGQEGRF